MLRKKINFKLGSPGYTRAPGARRLVESGYLVPGVAVGLLGLLSIAALNPMQAPSANAAEEMTLSAFLSPSITLSMSSSVSENIEPTVDGSFKNLSTVARVQVMNSDYYDISISGNPDMVGTANPDAKIAAISGDKTQANFVANTWGYAASKNNAGVTTPVAATTSTVYKAVPGTSTAIVSRQSTTNNAADDYYSLNFGAKVDTSIPADTYTSRVTVSVVASPVQATEYSLTYDGNGATGGTVPVKQTASSYEENYEFTVAGDTGNLIKTGYTFLGWADSASATTAQYTTGSKIAVSEATPNKTIYAVWVKNTEYTVTYNGNGNTSGTVPATQTESNNNESQTFTVAGQGTLAKTGYTFQGWTDTQAKANAGTVSYKAGATITLQKSAPTVTLYAVWKVNNPLGVETMQELTPAICKTLASGTTGRLRDTRDDKYYWVAKLPDGNCWTTQNMDYEIPGKTTTIGTARNTDSGYFWENGLKVMNTPSGSVTTAIDSTWTASTDVDFYTKNGNSAVDTINKIYDAHYLTGNYYQYSAAPTVCTGMGSQWALPTAGQTDTVNGSYNKLAKGQSTSSSSWILTKPYFFPRAGYISGTSGSPVGVGSEGVYWSSTERNTSLGYHLYFSGAVNPSDSGSRFNGFFVRCYVNGN